MVNQQAARVWALAITDRIVRMYGGSVSAANALDGGLIVNLELSLTE
jgi:C4-dicarboxylate-specific signal transduction histidine kinase